MREDALQEAWVAFLSGRDPARAVNTYARRERRRRMRDLPGQVAADRAAHLCMTR
jgi:hypothetical protein